MPQRNPASRHAAAALLLVLLVFEAEALSMGAEARRAEVAAAGPTGMKERAAPDALLETEEGSEELFTLGALAIGMVVYGLFTVAGWGISYAQMKRIQKGDSAAFQAGGAAKAGSAEKMGESEFQRIVANWNLYNEQSSWTTAGFLCQNAALSSIVGSIANLHNTLRETSETQTFAVDSRYPVVIESSQYIQLENVQIPTGVTEIKNVVGMRHAGSTVTITQGRGSHWREKMGSLCTPATTTTSVIDPLWKSNTNRMKNMQEVACGKLRDALSTSREKGKLVGLEETLREGLKVAEDRETKRVFGEKLTEMFHGVNGLVSETALAIRRYCTRQQGEGACERTTTFMNTMQEVSIKYKQYMGWTGKCEAFDTSAVNSGLDQSLMNSLMMDSDSQSATGVKNHENLVAVMRQYETADPVGYRKNPMYAYAAEVLLVEKCKTQPDLAECLAFKAPVDDTPDETLLQRIRRNAAAVFTKSDGGVVGPAEAVGERESEVAPTLDAVELEETSGPEAHPTADNLNPDGGFIQLDEEGSEAPAPLAPAPGGISEEDYDRIVGDKNPLAFTTDLLELHETTQAKTKFWDMGVPIQSSGAIFGVPILTVQPMLAPWFDILAPINVIVHIYFSKKTTKEIMCLRNVAQESIINTHSAKYGNQALVQLAQFATFLKASMLDKNQFYLIEGHRQEYKAETTVWNSGDTTDLRKDGHAMNLLRFDSTAAPVSGLLTNKCSVPMTSFRLQHLTYTSTCGIPKVLTEPWKFHDKAIHVRADNMYKVNSLFDWLKNGKKFSECSLVQRLDTTCNVMTRFFESVNHSGCGSYFTYSVKGVVRAVCAMAASARESACEDQRCRNLRDTVNMPCRVIDEYNEAMFNLEYWMKHLTDTTRLVWNPLNAHVKAESEKRFFVRMYNKLAMKKENRLESWRLAEEKRLAREK